MAETWTILNTIKWLTGYLSEKGIDEPRLNAEHLIAHSLGAQRIDLYLKFDQILTPDQLTGLKPLIERRRNREPLQYIIGSQPFRHIDIKVTKDVLIPRPETEIVVNEALKKIPQDSQLHILELGVGSGAIIASLAHERKRISLVGVEISPEALKVAEDNSLPYGERITLHKGDLFEPVGKSTYDLIISNPPYIPTKEWPELEPEVKDYEPETALLAGEDGLDFYRRIFQDVHNYLNVGGWIVLEMGDGQSESVKTLAIENGRFKNIEVIKDLCGKERVFLAQHMGE